MRFDTNLGNGTYTLCRIPCAFTFSTYSLGQPWIPSLTEQKQPRYQHIKYCTYWPVLCYFNNWNIIKLSHKETSGVELDKIYQAVLDGIIENTVALVQYG